MGEYADDIIDAIMDDPTPYYGSSRVSYRPPKAPQCRRCKEKHLTWVETEDGWRLHEMIIQGSRYDLVPHNCKMNFNKHARL